MVNQSPDDFRLLLARAGVKPTEQEMEKLKPMYEHYMERLKLLHEAGIAQEQPAAAPAPRPRTRGRK